MADDAETTKPARAKERTPEPATENITGAALDEEERWALKGAFEEQSRIYKKMAANYAENAGLGAQAAANWRKMLSILKSRK